MGKLRGVKREVSRVDISGGDWIEIKRGITVGEKAEMIDAALQRESVTSLAEHLRWTVAQAATYLTNWSLCDVNTGLPIVWPGPQKLEARIKVIKDLDDDTLIEIRDAIVAHLARVESEAKAGDPPAGDSGSSNS